MERAAAIPAYARPIRWPVGAWVAAAHDRVALAFAAQEARLGLWGPVAFGAGMAGHLSARTDPSLLGLGALWLAGLIGVWLVWRREAGPVSGPLLLALAWLAAGTALTELRVRTVAAPVLSFRYYGAIEGRIVAVDRSESDALRLTLDRVRLDDVAPERTPGRVRLSMHGDQPALRPDPGRVIALTGHLAPPMGPTEPGAFDFRRQAYFQGLGAIGYTRDPVVTLAPPAPGDVRLAGWRQAWAERVRGLVPGDAGGLVAAVMTGDRSGIPGEVNADLRVSGLYHIVSISGLHMALVVGFMFGLVRGGLAAVPPLALRLNTKKVAALVALPVAAAYLALAGRDVATERAFVMAAVMLLAILLDRAALSLRSVAVAAVVVLALRPESVLNAGFQMSFAAAVALVATAGFAQRTGLPRWATVPLVAVVASLVAGLATAPIAGAQFHRVSTYGLAANLVAAPAVSLLMMPGAVLMALLGPFGLDGWAAPVARWGAEWTLTVASRVAALDGAAGAVPAPPGAVLPLYALGGLWLAIQRGRWRWMGLGPWAVALVLWSTPVRPVLVVAEGGGQVGLWTGAGRSLAHPGAEDFFASAWLEADGDAGTVDEAWARGGWSRGERVAEAWVGGNRVLAVRGKTALAALEGCGGADVLIANVEAGPRPCLVLDVPALRRHGAVALGLAPDGSLSLRSAAVVAGDRPWSRPPRARRG